MKKLIKKSFHRESGFTLIELLIVIVIIGILAGVLIAVINPVRQQNRARNAAVRAAMLKAAFGINAVRAGIGKLPSNTQLPTELENMQPSTTGCTASDTLLNCMFRISGTTLPETCAANAEEPSGGTEMCYMRVISAGSPTFGDLTTGQFRIYAAAFNLDTVTPEDDAYVFDSNQGLLQCPDDVAWDTIVTPLTPLTIGSGPADCVLVSE